MRQPSQAFLDMQPRIKDARENLLAIFQLLTSWQQSNDAARAQLATAAEWEPAKTAKTTRT